jgi:hypothetical protein
MCRRQIQLLSLATVTISGTRSETTQCAWNLTLFLNIRMTKSLGDVRKE